MSTYKLTYFDLHAVGEGARFLFAFAGQKYEDNRIKFDVANIGKPEFKHSEEWVALKPSTPFGKLPILEVDGEVISQSKSIERFLAHRFGLGGSDEIQSAKVDSVIDQLNDVCNAMMKAHFAGGEEKSSFFANTLPGDLAVLEAFAAKNGQDAFVGDNITWADIKFLCFLPGVPIVTLAENFPHLKKIAARVNANEGIKSWLENRPKRPF